MFCHTVITGASEMLMFFLFSSNLSQTAYILSVESIASITLAKLSCNICAFKFVRRSLTEDILCAAENSSSIIEIFFFFSSSSERISLIFDFSRKFANFSEDSAIFTGTVVSRSFSHFFFSDFCMNSFYSGCLFR